MSLKHSSRGRVCLLEMGFTSGLYVLVALNNLVREVGGGVLGELLSVEEAHDGLPDGKGARIGGHGPQERWR